MTPPVDTVETFVRVPLRVIKEQEDARDPLALAVLASLYRRAAWTGMRVRWHRAFFRCQPGECVTSRGELAAELGLTDKQVRGALDRLVLRKAISMRARRGARGERAPHTHVTVLDYIPSQASRRLPDTVEGQGKDQVELGPGEGQARARGGAGDGAGLDAGGSHADGSGCVNAASTGGQAQGMAESRRSENRGQANGGNPHGGRARGGDYTPDTPKALEESSSSSGTRQDPALQLARRLRAGLLQASAGKARLGPELADRDAIQLMATEDAWAWTDIEAMLAFVIGDPFWGTTVASGGDLRRHARKLILKVQHGKHQAQQEAARQADAAQERRARRAQERRQQEPDEPGSPEVAMQHIGSVLASLSMAERKDGA